VVERVSFNLKRKDKGKHKMVQHIWKKIGGSQREKKNGGGMRTTCDKKGGGDKEGGGITKKGVNVRGKSGGAKLQSLKGDWRKRGEKRGARTVGWRQSYLFGGLKKKGQKGKKTDAVRKGHWAKRVSR